MEFKRENGYRLKIVNKISKFLGSWAGAAQKAFDIRDILVYGGLISIGYGFHQLFPWLGWVSFGVISMLLGLGWLFRMRK